MPTLVATIDLHIADSRSRIKKAGLRSSHGNAKNLKEVSFQLAVGEDETFEVEDFFYGHFRDLVDLEISNTDGTFTQANVVGVVAFPFACTVKITVPSNSSISLERVIYALYS